MAGDIKFDLGSLGSIMSGAGQLAKDIRTAITGKAILDPAQQAEIEAKLLELENKSMEIEASVLTATQEVNKTEAASPNPFIAGWRPFIGWVCGFACAYSFVILPLSNWVARVCFKISFEFPSLDSSSLTALTFGMLGIVGARTAEKFKGVAAK